MDKSTIQYNLTQEEAAIIEDVRAMVARRFGATDIIFRAWLQSDVNNLAEYLKGKTDEARQSDEPREAPYAAWVKKEQLTQNYYGMSVEEFMEHYIDCMGLDIVEEFLFDNLSVEDKLDAIVKCIKKNELVVDHLYDHYVTTEVKNSMFYERNDIATLTEQLVDMIMDGDWTPKN
jgi:hypothetical protein